MYRIVRLVLVFGMLSFFSAMGQKGEYIPLSLQLEQGYPRLYTTGAEKATLKKTIQEEKWAQDVLKGLHSKVDKYVDRHSTDKEWMVSRLQMHWKTKAKNIYVNGMNYSHEDGEAPVPTVRYPGSRDYTTPYGKPKLEDILPYMDDPRGLYYPNKTKEGNPFEWTAQNKTGRVICSINQEIIGLARDAAFLYWLEGDEKYATFAFDLFHTYMLGIYHRNAPIDIANTHIQTLLGLSNFQVIHESVLVDLAVLYDFLHSYIESTAKDEIEIYEETIKKWNDQIIKNGVPQNNWNLHQAKIILKAAMVLQDNDAYADKKGREYYIDYIINKTSARQWSIPYFLEYGYDKSNGIWGECPGYAQGVTKDMTNFVRDFYNTFHFNLLPHMPVIEKAVEVLPQYLFPNGQTVAFGDTYYGDIYVEAMADMVRMAQVTDNSEMEEKFTTLYRCFAQEKKMHRKKSDLTSLFATKPLQLKENYAVGKIADYQSTTFHAPNVSWHVQRMGQGANALMASLNGSLGNHMHANGINLELFGKGVVQGADAGKGSSYFQAPYLEFYSQFPAHNTVMVDGISSYPIMLSTHGFDLIGQYPESGVKDGFYSGVTYSDVYFEEPASFSDQERIFSIIEGVETTGYYVDIFRSKKQRKDDKFHDYFYHNLGQSMKLTDTSGQIVDVKPSEEMAFAGGHLFALDYQWDKKSKKTNQPFLAEWTIEQDNSSDNIGMRLWMNGEEGREVFTLKSPPCKSFKKGSGVDYAIDKAPYLTLAVRQHGAAWAKPFVAIYEPTSESDKREITNIVSLKDKDNNQNFAGAKVTLRSGRTDFILSSAKNESVESNGVVTNAKYAVVKETSSDELVLFYANGQYLNYSDFKLTSEVKGNVTLEIKDGKMYLHNTVPVEIKSKRQTKKYEPGNRRLIRG